MGLMEPEEVMGREDYDVAVWATRLRIAQRALPQLLGLLGLNAAAISKNMSGSHPMLAAALAGGKYPLLASGLDMAGVPAFASWEMFVAKAIYWYIIPAFQFWVAAVFVDTWQYFLHRAMHMNKWLYSKNLVHQSKKLLIIFQLPFTPDITVCMYLMHTERCTTTHLKDFFLTPLAQALDTK